VGPDEDSTRPAEEQGHGPAARRGCRQRGAPRARHCLLKGCERRFDPRRAAQRYCSEECRRAARRWSRWKAQQSYRATAAGKDKRNEQSRRYRERVRNHPTSNARRGSSGDREGNHPRVFSTKAATGRAAMRGSSRNGDPHTSASVRARAGAPWNESGNGNGAGAARCDSSGRVERTIAPISLRY
jgi:hypothetical protein